MSTSQLLPPGIEGIAHLERAAIRERPPGLDGFYCQLLGQVVEPVQCQGIKLSQVLPIYATPATGQTFEDNLARVINELRKLGVDALALDFDCWEEALLRLEQARPWFKFRTFDYKGITRVSWDGIIEECSPDVIVTKD